MEKIGNYVVESELSGSAHVSIYSVRHEDQPSSATVCLKLWHTLSEDSYSDDIGHLFVETAKIQAELAKECPKTWVEVLDYGTVEAGSYIVTPLYKDNLARGLGTLAADGILLNALISSLLTALEDLEKHCSRCHGNLKPSKIFLEGTGAIGNRKIRLNELAPEELINTSVYANPDLRSLGEIIFMLASRSSSVSSSMRNVPAHTQWPRLGSQEQDWKNLCSELLSPNGRFQSEGLAGLREELKKFGTAKKKSSKPLIFAGAAVAIAIIAGIIIFIQTRPEPIDLAITDQYTEYVSSYEDWMKDFATSFQRRRSLIEEDEYLSDTVAGILADRGADIIPSEAFQVLLPSDPNVIPESLNTNRGFQRRVTDAYRFLLQLRRALEEWPVRTSVLEQAERLREAGLELPASELENLVSTFQYDDRLFDQLLEIRDTRSLAEDLMAAWTELQTAHQELESTQDPFLKKLPPWQLGQLKGSEVSLSNLMPLISEQLRVLEPVREIIKSPSWTQQYAYELFLESEDVDALPLEQPEDINKWLALMGDYRRVPDPRNTEKPILNDSVDQIQSKIAQLNDYGLKDDARSFALELESLQQAISEIDRIPSVQKELASLNDALRLQKRNLVELDSRVTELISKNIIDPADWLAKWRDEQLPVDAIVSERWVRNRDAIIQQETVSSLQGRQADMYNMDVMLGHYRTLLIGVDQALPAPQLTGDVRSPEMDALLEPFIQDLHRKSLGAILEELPAVRQAVDLELDAFLDSPDVQAIARQYESELQAAGQFSSDFFQYNRMLSAEAPPSEAFFNFVEEELFSASGWASRIGATADNVPAIRSFRQLMDTRSSDSIETLFALIQDRKTPMATRWTAWKRLLSLDTRPRTAADWIEWTSLFRSFRDQLSQEYHPSLEGARFWAEAAGLASDYEAFRNAVDAMTVFGGSTDALPDALKFVKFVMDQRQFLASDRSMFSAGGEPVREWKNTILNALNDTFAASDDPLIKAFREGVEAIDPDKESEEVDLSKVGPGSVAPWEMSSIAEDGTVTYRWEQYDLDFRPVDDGTGNVSYVSTIEMPVGLFTQWYMDFPDSLNAIRDLIQANQTGVESRSGLQTWMTDTDGQPDLVFNWISLSPSWELKLYAQQPKNPKPYDEHPIQYVSPRLASAIAAAFNCRLVRPAEYKVLLDAAQVDDPGWNRRDQTWANHQRHIVATNAAMLSSDPPWPDNGIFIPDGLPVERQAEAKPCVDTDDGLLWFSDVYISETASPFKNLIGNVAEYAYDDENDQYFVIGSSALSPPEIGPKTPFAVNPEEAGSGFADVGFRLAFDMPVNTPGAMLSRIILDPQYAEDRFPLK